MNHNDISRSPKSSEASPVYVLPAPYASDDVNLLELWLTLWRRRYIIAIVALLVAMPIWTAAFVMTPVYRVEARLLPPPESSKSALGGLASQFGGIAALAGFDLPGAGGDEVEALAVLRSRVFTESFIEQHDLLPHLFPEKWDPAKAEWAVSIDETPSSWDGYKLFQDGMRQISEDPSTGIVTVAIEWTDRVRAAEWANDLVAKLNSTMRQRAIEEAERSLAFLNSQLEQTPSVEVRQVLYSLIETQVKTITLANVRDEYAFKVIDPAQPPDPEDMVRPKKLLMLLLGGILGGFVGVIIAFIWDLIAKQKRKLKSHLAEEGPSPSGHH